MIKVIYKAKDLNFVHVDEDNQTTIVVSYDTGGSTETYVTSTYDNLLTAQFDENEFHKGRS